VVLVGPNDDELAASAFQGGKMQPTVAEDDDYWANLPKKKICVFEAKFYDVPMAETYRVKYREIGVDDLSFEREMIDAYSGQMDVFFGSRIRD
jgi:hypothetical protein